MRFLRGRGGASSPAERGRRPGGGSGPLRLVVGLNQVDRMVAGGWDDRLNLPSARAALEIERKADDIIRLLQAQTGVSPQNVEYYSALRRYRLHNLLATVVRNTFGGFRLSDVQPLNFEDVDGVDEQARAFVKEERARRVAKAERTPGRAELLAELGRVLDRRTLALVESKFRDEMARAPRVAVVGQTGVGKTTTVNALFSTAWRTSGVGVGTTSAQEKTVGLPSGGDITVVDLPGYGRSITEDATYRRIYTETIPSCDLVLLVIQADRGDLADDLQMVQFFKGLLVGAPRRDESRDRKGTITR